MNARLLAVQCLVRIDKGGYSNLVLDETIRTNNLSKSEKGFLVSLVYTTLERQITLDYILSQYLRIPIGRLDRELTAILRSGLAQIICSGVPAYAAVNESVKLAAAVKKTSVSGTVNAVLRKAAAFDMNRIDEISDIDDRVSVSMSVNKPLVQLIRSQYPCDYENIFAGMQSRRIPYFRVNPLKTTTDGAVSILREKGYSPVKQELPCCVSIEKYSRETVDDANLTEEGLLRIQSYSSQAAVCALAPVPGALLVDLCAAPGGKALTAAQMMGNRGTVAAFDRHENRLKLLDRRAPVEGISIVRSDVFDSTIYMPEYDGRADFVIADVPCTGYGKICSKPELRMKLPPKDSLLYETQLRILSNGAQYLKPGGRLLYSTCTINRKENREIVERFLGSNTEYTTDKDISIKGFTNHQGYMMKLPSETDGEGFFFTVLIRREV